MAELSPDIRDTQRLRTDPDLRAKLRELRKTDNLTNFYYIARAYLVLAAAIGGAVAFYWCREMAGLSLWWNVPVTLVAILMVGASQHQLAGAAHEATHHTLFRNRRLNEWVSDWLCMFPLFSTTYSFRLYHLAHHQFVNDPTRDPDFAMLARSGHWMHFPVSKSQFLRKLLAQFSLVGLVCYALARVEFNALSFEGADVYRRGKAGSKLADYAMVAYVPALPVLQLVLTPLDNPWLLIIAPLGCWSALSVFFLFLPERAYAIARIRPAVSPKNTAVARTAFYTLLIVTLSWLRWWTGRPVLGYFFVLWVIPLFTTFPFFMIMRQLVQHGNADRGWLTNTRVFLVNRLVRYAVFPFGMDYHLPHHMYATVPHYRLPDLHRFLQRSPVYADACTEVENYFLPPRGAVKPRPTVLDVVGPSWAGTSAREAFIDASVLDDWQVDDLDEIRREV